MFFSFALFCGGKRRKARWVRGCCMNFVCTYSSFLIIIVKGGGSRIQFYFTLHLLFSLSVGSLFYSFYFFFCGSLHVYICTLLSFLSGLLFVSVISTFHLYYYYYHLCSAFFLCSISANTSSSARPSSYLRFKCVCFLCCSMFIVHGLKRTICVIFFISSNF